MPKISSLSTSTNLQSTDILVGTDVSDSNKSKNFTLGDLASFINTTPNGTGTPAFVPRFSSATTIEDSIIYASPTGVGINNSSPQQALHINGNVSTLRLLVIQLVLELRELLTQMTVFI